MATKLDYGVQRVRAGKRNYYYFRNRASGVRIKLQGEPGSPEYNQSYEAALREHAPIKALPQIIRARGVARGSLAWVLEQYKARSKEWLEAAEFDPRDLRPQASLAGCPLR